MQSWIVVEDLEKRYLEGEVVDETKARQAESWGAVLLPVDPDTVRRSGVGGYYRRAWGKGLTLSNPTPRMVAPLMLFMSKANSRLIWRARLVPDDAVVGRWLEGATFEGFLRIVPDSSQESPHRFGATEQKGLEMRELPAARRLAGGVVVGGEVAVFVPQDGHYGAALHGVIGGFRVQWLAASQVPR
jgi:hypothetical protein